MRMTELSTDNEMGLLFVCATSLSISYWIQFTTLGNTLSLYRLNPTLFNRKAAIHKHG